MVSLKKINKYTWSHSRKYTNLHGLTQENTQIYIISLKKIHKYTLSHSRKYTNIHGLTQENTQIYMVSLKKIHLNTPISKFVDFCTIILERNPIPLNSTSDHHAISTYEETYASATHTQRITTLSYTFTQPTTTTLPPIISSEQPNGCPPTTCPIKRYVHPHSCIMVTNNRHTQYRAT